MYALMLYGTIIVCFLNLACILSEPFYYEIYVFFYTMYALVICTTWVGSRVVQIYQSTFSLHYTTVHYSLVFHLILILFISSSPRYLKQI